jgi:ABC-2 type transport system permease protein
MIRLTTVELRRLTARRLTAIGVLGVLVITALLLVAVWIDSKPPSEAEQRASQEQFRMAHEYWEQHADEDRARCAEEWRKQPDPKPALEEMCNFTEPTIDQFGKPRVVFAETMPELLLGSSYLLVFAAFLIGASFVGAEFSTGSIGNWLTFEPRRLRVYGSKLLAAAIGFVPVAVGILAILMLGTYLIVDQLGVTSGTTGKVWGDLVATAARAVLLIAVGAALGGVVGLLLRHTAAAIGVAMGYLVLIEGVFAGFLNKAQPWLVKLNFDAFVRHDSTYYLNECSTGSDGSYLCSTIEKTLSFEHGAWYLGILAVVLVLVGGAVFYRRDVNA